MCVMLILLSSHASLFLWWIGIVGWVPKPNVICSFGGGGGSLLSIYAAKQKIGLFKTHAQRAAKD